MTASEPAPPATVPAPAPSPACAVIADHCHALLQHPALAGDTTLNDIVAQCGQPLRVLIVGDVSTGKSTLLNALVARPLARTAFAETTSSVTWYHGPHLSAPALPDPSHRAVAVGFPLADRLLLGDSPGLNTLSDNPRETLRMMGGGDLSGAAAAFVCILDGGRVDHWADRLEELAALSAGPFDLVGNVVAVMSKIELVDEDADTIEHRVRGDTPVTFRFAGVNQRMAVAARTGLVDRRTVAVLDALRSLPSSARWSVPSWDRVAAELSGRVPDADREAFEEAVGGPKPLPELVRATTGMHDPADVAAVFERMSRIGSLEAVLTDMADDADLFTSTAALVRLRRLAARLRDEPAARVRATLAEVTRSPRYQALWPRAAARLLRHTPAGHGLSSGDLTTALRLLRGEPCGRHDTLAALARWTARTDDPFTDSRSRTVAGFMADTARRALEADVEEKKL
ncbi:GTPase [Streptomyces sp. NPDC004610]|uniref:GTPase n=1 Tax=unclassified Streptomyces TaxID=2593676 RepID=UPI0033A9D31E